MSEAEKNTIIAIENLSTIVDRLRLYVKNNELDICPICYEAFLYVAKDVNEVIKSLLTNNDNTYYKLTECSQGLQ